MNRGTMPLYILCKIAHVCILLRFPSGSPIFAPHLLPRITLHRAVCEKKNPNEWLPAPMPPQASRDTEVSLCFLISALSQFMSGYV